MPKEHEHSAYRFHTDLFLSGLERIILASIPLGLWLFKLVDLKDSCRSHEKRQPHTTQPSTLN